mgnify:CR=1 FL=1
MLASELIQRVLDLETEVAALKRQFVSLLAGRVREPNEEELRWARDAIRKRASSPPPEQHEQHIDDAG